MKELTKKNNFVITLLEGVSESIEKNGFDADKGNWNSPEDSRESIKRRLIVARQEIMKMIHDIDRKGIT